MTPRLAWALMAPALAVMGAVAAFPVAWTAWESLHWHDLRMPWLGRPFIGLDNYVATLTDTRVHEALAHTGVFAALTVSLEMAAGLGLALMLDRLTRARGLVHTAVLLPWAVPTVVGALVWRFMFESPDGIASTVLAAAGMTPPTWFADATAAWLPLVLADAWKTTPFVALLLLAGLQGIDRALYDAARVDGASPWRQFVDITVPLLAPSLLVAALFRTLDAFRVFDLVYVMTGGGPGTATEPLALLTHATLLQHLQFGRGAALSMLMFAGSFLVALAAIRLFGRRSLLEPTP